MIYVHAHVIMNLESHKQFFGLSREHGDFSLSYEIYSWQPGAFPFLAELWMDQVKHQ